MKIIVCQHGSRHRYAIPQLLAEAGLLYGCYTDSNAQSMLGKLAGRAAKVLHCSAVQRLAARIPALAPELLRSSDLPFWAECIAPLIFRSPEKRSRFRHNVLARKMIRWGVGDAAAVYSMYDEAFEFLKYAKEQGKKIFIDIFIAPDVEYLMARFQGKQCSREAYYNRELSECLQYADYLVCPSEFVARGVRDFYPEYADRICLCPYGSSISYGGEVNQPIPGRFFWAGNDPLRKGLPLLAEVAGEILKEYPSADFRIAGITDPKIVNCEKYQSLHFLGKLNRSEMQNEFLSADAFVLPTVAEGMASVCIEALAAGCPLVVPTSAGIDPVNGEFGGIVLKDLSEKELSTALRRLLDNREERAQFARKALKISSFYTMNAWKLRLSKLFLEKCAVNDRKIK